MPRLSIPADDSVHKNELLQWWYWTGHLEADSGARFGFLVVFFAAELFHNRIWGQMAHSAVSDMNANVFKSQEAIWTGQPELLPGAFSLATPNNRIVAVGKDGVDRLETRVGGYSFALDVTAQNQPTLHYGGDLHRYSFGGDTYYYSRGSMQTKGTIETPAGETLSVKGSAWFDRQFGELAPAVFVGWQWFAIQLDDGSQIMLYDFNRFPGEFYGKLTKSNGTSQELSGSDCRVTVTDHWRSQASGINYPHLWRINVLGKEYRVTPMMDDQEMDARFWIGPRYWEGACAVEGACTGKAYVELCGFSP